MQNCIYKRKKDDDDDDDDDENVAFLGNRKNP